MNDQEQKPRRKRGVPLNDLDRRRQFVIGHTGRRWEVLGEFLPPGAPWPTPAPDAGASAEGVRTAPEPGRHAAPEPGGPVDAQNAS